MKQRNMRIIGQNIELSDIYYFQPKNKETKKKRKLILWLLLALFMIFNTGISYTYWDGNISPINSDNLKIINKARSNHKINLRFFFVSLFFGWK